MYMYLIFIPLTEREVQTISTGGEKWFNRTFNTDQYYYCKSCKMRRFANCSSESGNNCSACAMATKEQPDGKNKTVTECSEVEMEKSVIFLGDFNKTHPSSKLESTHVHVGRVFFLEGGGGFVNCGTRPFEMYTIRSWMLLTQG